MMLGQALYQAYHFVVKRYLWDRNLTSEDKKRFHALTRREPCMLPGAIENVSKLSIACILDTFSFDSFSPEAKFKQIPCVGAVKHLEINRPDFIFIESSWFGLEKSWFKKISVVSSELLGVIQWASDHQVPTVFWHKELPVHFDTFFYVSRLFDYVFVTDSNCIDGYQKKLGHNRVYSLPFALQPKIHHDQNKIDRKKSAFFAGSFYPKSKYPKRYQDFHILYNAMSSVMDIDIFDRNFSKKKYAFPSKYQSNIKGTVPYNQMNDVYCSYEYGINLNTVKNSPTMFSRRVFELIGTNTIVVSNYSKGVKKIFGDAVICSDSYLEIQNRINELEKYPEKKAQMRRRALKIVQQYHTYKHRLEYVVQMLTPDKG